MYGVTLCAFCVFESRMSLQITEVMMLLCWKAGHKLLLDALCTVHSTSSHWRVKRSISVIHRLILCHLILQIM